MTRWTSRRIEPISGRMRTRAIPGSIALSVLALAGLLAGCADSGESGATRLDRLEARLDRLDERLTRAEGQLIASAADDAGPTGGADPGLASERVEAALQGVDPERRARLRKQFRQMRGRIDKLREGADLKAKPGTPEFRRGLVLEMMRRSGPGARLLRQYDEGSEDSQSTAPEDDGQGDASDAPED